MNLILEPLSKLLLLHLQYYFLQDPKKSEINLILEPLLKLLLLYLQYCYYEVSKKSEMNLILEPLPKLLLLDLQYYFQRDPMIYLMNIGLGNVVFYTVTSIGYVLPCMLVVSQDFHSSIL